MSQIARSFFLASPLLGLAVVALLIFFSVFIAIVVSTVRKRPTEIDALSRLPFEENGRD